MLKNIDIAEFTAEVRSRREYALSLVGTSALIATYRDALRVVCDEDCWKVEQPIEIAPVRAATFDEIHSSLSFAACRLQQFGASDAQVRLLATLAVKQGLALSQIEMSTLSKFEASAMIDNMKKDD